MTNRNRMHVSHIDEFARFLLSCGYEHQSPKQYEVIRMVHPDKGGACIVWLKVGAKEHCTVSGESQDMFDEWFSFDRTHGYSFPSDG